jgi:hypothetical protein
VIGVVARELCRVRAVGVGEEQLLLAGDDGDVDEACAVGREREVARLGVRELIGEARCGLVNARAVGGGVAAAVLRGRRGDARVVDDAQAAPEIGARTAGDGRLGAGCVQAKSEAPRNANASRIPA